MSLIALSLNLLLAALMVAALTVGLRLNKRLKVLKDSQDGFAGAVRELNLAAARAEQGLADLRAATDEATDLLADRIEKGRALAAKLERLTEAGSSGKLERLLDAAPARAAAAVPDAESMERRFGALLAAAREVRPSPSPEQPPRRQPQPLLLSAQPDDDLFEDSPTLRRVLGVRR
jgi:hypothetical protein